MWIYLRHCGLYSLAINILKQFGVCLNLNDAGSFLIWNFLVIYKVWTGSFRSWSRSHTNVPPCFPLKWVYTFFLGTISGTFEWHKMSHCFRMQRKNQSWSHQSSLQWHALIYWVTRSDNLRRTFANDYHRLYHCRRKCLTPKCFPSMFYLEFGQQVLVF